mmetsp:Transcript_18210/g.57242  ORF Transcript_18210/g.57242 Transcript_18210/m.57242 type:complete len:226 (+) Transcript_18210:1992-2669(+)
MHDAAPRRSSARAIALPAPTDRSAGPAMTPGSPLPTTKSRCRSPTMWTSPGSKFSALTKTSIGPSSVLRRTWYLSPDDPTTVPDLPFSSGRFESPTTVTSLPFANNTRLSSICAFSFGTISVSLTSTASMASSASTGVASGASLLRGHSTHSNRITHPAINATPPTETPTITGRRGFDDFLLPPLLPLLPPTGLGLGLSVSAFVVNEAVETCENVDDAPAASAAS